LWIEIAEIVLVPIMRLAVGTPPELILEAAAQKMIAASLHQLFKADIVLTLSRPFGLSGEAHVQIPVDSRCCLNRMEIFQTSPPALDNTFAFYGKRRRIC